MIAVRSWPLVASAIRSAPLHSHHIDNAPALSCKASRRAVNINSQQQWAKQHHLYAMSIALRPWPAPKTGERKPEELKTQIAQLVIERGGHVRNITEHSLQDDIIAGKDIADDSSEQAEKKADRKEAQTREERQQDIQRLQQEMWNEMEWASSHKSREYQSDVLQVG